MQIWLLVAAASPDAVAQMVALDKQGKPSATGDTAPERRFGDLVQHLLLSPQAGPRIQTSIALRAASKGLPTRPFEDAGVPSLRDYLLELLLAKLDLVTEQAESSTSLQTRSFFAVLSNTIKTSCAYTDKPKSEAEAKELSELDALAPTAGALSKDDQLAKFEPVFRSIMQRVVSHDVQEKRLDDDSKQDYLLTGLLGVLMTLVKAVPEFRQVVREPGTGDVEKKGAADNFIRVVIDDLLFYAPVRAEELDETVHAQLPKCKNKSTRKEALALLSALCQDSAANVISVSNALVPVMSASAEAAKAGGSKASTRLYDEKAKADHGYLGYRNLGCICYMNAMMQQLYMVPHFRLAVLAADCDVVDNDDEDGAGVVDALRRVKDEEESARKTLLKKVEAAKAAGEDLKALGDAGLDYGGRDKASDDILY